MNTRIYIVSVKQKSSEALTVPQDHNIVIEYINNVSKEMSVNALFATILKKLICKH